MHYTKTSHGKIEHLRIKLPGQPEFFAPVKMELARFRPAKANPLSFDPMVRDGRYVHALPGGGEILGDKAAEIGYGEMIG